MSKCSVFSFFVGKFYSYFTHGFGEKDNVIPLFDWGQYYGKDGKIWLPFFVQVDHSFVDGVHIGKLAEKLQLYLDTYE